jgi:putative NAD(P)-binding protein
MVVRVFVAGGTGVIGRRLVPQLVARGHQVTATTTSAAKLGLLEQLGATGVVMDGLDAASVGEAVATARPDAIVNEMTGLSEAHAGQPNLRKPDRFFAITNRLRSEGTDHLLAAAEATGVSHVAAQSVAIFNGIRTGDGSRPRTRWRWRRRQTRSDTSRTWWSRRAARSCAMAGSTGRAPPTIRSSSCASGCSRWQGGHRLLLVGASRRRGERYRAGRGTARGGRVQHRGRRPRPGQPVAAVPGLVRGGKTTQAAPQVAGPAAGRRVRGGHDDRRARLLQRQGQAGARLAAALPLVARQGFKEEFA